MTDDATQALRATAHPLRLRILSLLTGTELSAAEVARELDITHANASYHLRQLLEAGQLVVASEEVIRGGTAKRYRHPWDREHRTARSSEEREAWVRAMAAELVRRTSVAQGSPGQFTDAEVWVTPEVFEEVRTLLKQCSDRIHAAARPPRTEGTIKVAMTTAYFEMARP
jgi:DNA-binding transcriptional ArsR family regulator